MSNIPKIIHYCWFGNGQKPESVIKYIESWKNKLPDYEIMEWNESNFDVNYNTYSREAYENKKYAFVSDIARIIALYEYGGIYLDTDVEVVKKFDELLSAHCVLGFEKGGYIATSFMASRKEHPLFTSFLNLYNEESFVKESGELNTLTNVSRLTDLLSNMGLKRNNERQTVGNDIEVYPEEYFSPYDYINGTYNDTTNTYCIHHFNVTWKSPMYRFLKNVKMTLRKLKLVK